VSALRRHLARSAEPYLYTAPVLILIMAVMLVPLSVGLSYAFRDIQLLDPFSGGFVGFDHFRELKADRSFRAALLNTLIWTGASVALQSIFGLILALLLNREFPGRRLVQALVFLPWAVPTFLVGLDWAWLFNPVVGPLRMAVRPEDHARYQQSACRSGHGADRADRRRNLVGHSLLRHHEPRRAAIDSEGPVRSGIDRWREHVQTVSIDHVAVARSHDCYNDFAAHDLDR